MKIAPGHKLLKLISPMTPTEVTRVLTGGPLKSLIENTNLFFVNNYVSVVIYL